jgi:hypothetical protein
MVFPEDHNTCPTMIKVTIENPYGHWNQKSKLVLDMILVFDKFILSFPRIPFNGSFNKTIVAF